MLGHLSVHGIDNHAEEIVGGTREAHVADGCLRLALPILDVSEALEEYFLHLRTVFGISLRSERLSPASELHVVGIEIGVGEILTDVAQVSVEVLLLLREGNQRREAVVVSIGYVEFLEQYTFEDPYTFTFNGEAYQIYSVTGNEDKLTTRVPVSGNYELSGDNKDSFIITAHKV